MISGLFVQSFDWRGRAVEVSYEPNWLGVSEAFGQPMAHLQVRSLAPDDAALPITETGYRSRVVAAQTVLEEGGPVGFVRAWLDHAASSAAWETRERAALHHQLF